MVAWRRIATAEARVGGVTIPKGGKILMVMASANHDPRHFERVLRQRIAAPLHA